MTLFHAPRALTVRSAAIPEVAGAPALVPLKLAGREGVSRDYDYDYTRPRAILDAHAYVSQLIPPPSERRP